MLGRVIERAVGLYPVLSTAAARWRPAEPWGHVARVGEVQREGKWVQEVARAPRGAVGEAGGGLRPSLVAGSAAQRRRVEKQRGREEKEGG